MRLKKPALALAALGAAVLVAAGLYQRYATQTADRRAGPPAGEVATVAARSDSGFSFSALETPRPLPALRFTDVEGREMTLAAFKGKTVLLNIWATWCVPCRDEMPALDRLQAKLGGPDFQVVALSIDREGLPAVTAFYRELGLDALDIYVDRTGESARVLRAVGIPTTLLVDRDGQEIGRIVGPAAWDSDEAFQSLRRYGAPDPEGDPREGASGAVEDGFSRAPGNG